MNYRVIIKKTLIPILFLAVFQFTNCYPVEKKIKKEATADSSRTKVEYGKKKSDISKQKKLLSSWLKRNTWYSIVPSAAAVVVQGDEIVFKETVRCSPNKLYMVASLTKTFVALSIIQLAEKGIISFKDPISKHLQINFENKELNSDPITIRHLLTHTSGLVEKENPLHLHMKMPFTIPEQRYPAGYRFNYCNEGYNLLAYLIFEATGMSMGEYVTRNILIPLEMFDSKAPGNAKGAAGIRCSINDLSKYIIMILNKGKYKKKRIISRRMFNEILKESVAEPYSKKREYRGICWRIWTIDNEIYSMHHAAHMNGAGGYMQIFPKHNIAYIFISNPPIYDRKEFYSYYYGIKHRMIRFSQFLMNDDFKPLNFRADRPSLKDLKLFVGRYKKHNNGRYIDIILHGRGYLIAKKSYTGLRYAIIPTSMHTFVYIYPGQSEKGEIFDFILRNNRVIGLGSRDGYYVR